MSDKIFCGSGRIIQTQYGILPKISFSDKDLEVLNQNVKNGWVNLEMKEKRNKVEGKPTHYIVIDTWQPNERIGYTTDEKSNEPEVSEIIDDQDIPF